MSVRAIAAAIASCAIVAAAAATPTMAATELGQTDIPVACGDSGYSVVQSAVSNGPGYVVPAGGGVITAWSVMGNDDAEAVVQLRIFRPSADGYLLAGESDPSGPLVTDALNTYPSRVPVAAGEVLGMRVLAGAAPPCALETLDPADAWDEILPDDMALGEAREAAFGGTGYRVNLSARLEPDADADGYGDETQDRCPSDPAVHEVACPAADPDPASQPDPEPPADPQPGPAADPAPQSGPAPAPAPAPQPGAQSPGHGSGSAVPARAAIRIGRARVRRRSGTVVVPVTCAAARGAACRARLVVTFHARGRRLAPLARRVRLAAGRTALVRLAGSPAERRRLRSLRRVAVTVRAG